MRTNKERCLLAETCKIAGGPACNDQCTAFIAMHGMTGKGGRAGAAKVPSDYRLLTLGNSPARGGQSAIYETLEKYIDTFDRQFDTDGGERIKSLYLWSESPGTGKTTTAAALLNTYITRHYIGSLHRGLQPLQLSAYFLDVNEFQTDYNLVTMTDDEAGMNRIKATIKRSQDVPFLVMDDLGVREATNAYRSYLHAVINYRTTNGKPTVFTTNFALSEMARIFDDRLYDRIRDQCAEIHFGGASKRGRR